MRARFRYFCISTLLLGLSSLSAIGHADTSIPDYLRQNAVVATIAASQECKTLGNFYWEVGDANGMRSSGKIGTTYNANTTVLLASSSKLVSAAYMIQKFGVPTQAQAQYLTMRAGYTSFLDPSCTIAPTVGACALTAFNGLRTAADVGYFYYNGGNFQQAAMNYGLGWYTAAALTKDAQALLGADTGVSYWFPGLAGGLRMSANGYAVLLRKIMTDKLLIGKLMTANRTCTSPTTCPTSSYSPFPHDWDYGLGHWIEHEAGAADEAYSSVGLYGFYPWISADKQYYGVLSTENLLTVNSGPVRTSMTCGGKIRRAWISGITQN